MKDFWMRNKVFIIVICFTLVFVIGGVLLFSKGASNNNSSKVETSLLVPQNVIATSGFSNGKYLPATASASLTLVEFGDYECPACSVYSPFIKQILTDYPGRITYVFRNYPLPQHKNAPISSYAVESAGLQGMYWQMQEKMYATQADWSNLGDPTSVFLGYAKELNLNIEKFTADLASQVVKDKVQSDYRDGNTIGITETPTFYLDGQKINLTGTLAQFKSLIEAKLINK